MLLAWRLDELVVVLGEEAFGWDNVLDQRGGGNGVVGVGWVAGLERRDRVALLAAIVVVLVVDRWGWGEVGDPAAVVVLVGGEVGGCAEAGRVEVSGVSQGRKDLKALLSAAAVAAVVLGRVVRHVV